MAVRCKMTCTRVADVRTHGWYTKNGDGKLSELRFSAVTGGSEEDLAFFASTPSASLEFLTANPAAAAEFEPGATYYVTIERAS